MTSENNKKECIQYTLDEKMFEKDMRKFKKELKDVLIKQAEDYHHLSTLLNSVIVILKDYPELRKLGSTD